ncbi:MAG: bifunctional oligoribonuclease/PAP phosphatase NrnA [Eubacteriales bacterium]|nr:bifunctional oligoribonuclease/PAP phosphatase NrnA [Eubacteriales bacterium]
MTHIDVTEAAELIGGSSNILILSHENQDGDACGSMVALGLGLKQLGHKVDYVADRNKSGLENLLEETSFFNGPLDEKYDLAIAVDCSTMEYLFGNSELSRAKKVLVLDHHSTNTGYGDVNIVYPSSSCAAEVIYSLLKVLGCEITRQIAHAVYIAIDTDTGNFSYSNTTAYCHLIASELYERYDDFYLIDEALLMREKDVIELAKIGFGNTKFYGEGKLVVSALLYEDGFSDSINAEADILTNTIKYIYGVVVSVTVRQTGEEAFKLSMRSADFEHDVSEFCSRFGGGGHIKAAGCTFLGTYKELEKVFAEYAQTL